VVEENWRGMQAMQLGAVGCREWVVVKNESYPQGYYSTGFVAEVEEGWLYQCSLRKKDDVDMEEAEEWIRW
jgi:hypothetical protein